ncbi:hypothetical protein GWI33_010935, partial [Rhynchophorus ferrugineus]
MTDLHRLSIRELSEGLTQAKFSSRELTQHYLNRIAKIDPQINSYVTVTTELALAQADAADAVIKSGNASPLTGIPLAHKDIFCTQGVKTTAGSKMLDNFISPYDATVVAKAKATGLVTLGKVNMDEFAMGSTSESSHFGATKNPWALDRVPGGSSGGSAAAVAADLAPFATGTDTGGSIRQPASFCGLTGLKPTYGRVSRFGMIAYASSLDQGGPMARSAEDCAYLLNTIAGHDVKDSTSVEHAVDDYIFIMTDLHRLSIRELSEGLTQAKFSSRELTQHYLNRIAKIDPQINSYVTVTTELALAQADAADAVIKSGNASPLTGIPLAHKDIFCTQGVKTTAGSKMLDNFISPYDATVVAKAKATGLVTLGKVNMDEFAMGSTSESSHFGATKNPWALDRVPGGSSGGSAAAVAADLAPFATGTDTGGSIRQPASFCGLTGLKPTYGRVSRFGMIAYASSLDQGGPMARSAEDCAYLLNTIAGHDVKDSTSVEHAVDDYVANLNATTL